MNMFTDTLLRFREFSLYDDGHKAPKRYNAMGLSQSLANILGVGGCWSWIWGIIRSSSYVHVTMALLSRHSAVASAPITCPRHEVLFGVPFVSTLLWRHSAVTLAPLTCCVTLMYLCIDYYAYIGTPTDLESLYQKGLFNLLIYGGGTDNSSWDFRIYILRTMGFRPLLHLSFAISRWPMTREKLKTIGLSVFSQKMR